VLLARVDEIDPSIRNDPSLPGEEIVNAKKAAAKLLGIPAANIIPNVNYLEESKKSFPIDRNLWIIVHKALSQSKHYLEYLTRQAKQEAVKSVSPIQRKLNDLEKAKNQNLKRAEKCEAEAKSLRQEVDKLGEKVNTIQNKLDASNANALQWKQKAANAQSRVSWWFTIFMIGLGAVLLANPAALAFFKAAFVKVLKQLVSLAQAQLEKHEMRAPKPATPVELPAPIPKVEPTAVDPDPSLSTASQRSPDASFVLESMVAPDGQTPWILPAAPDAAASGLKWKNVGTQKPSTGLEITSQALANALRSKVEFNDDEWKAFDISVLRYNHFLKSGDSYFKPAAAAD